MDTDVEKTAGSGEPQSEGQTGNSAHWVGAAAEEGTKLEDVLRKHDESRISKCNVELDTLLVFAGLFSAILTAFNIESHKTLQTDPNELSVLILSQIYAQLSPNSSGNFLSLPSTPSTLYSPFQVPAAAVRINTLWFASLVCSLVAASIAIFVKQWLREYLEWGCTSPEERIRVRHARYEGLLRWRVFEIAECLPLILQISLLLFFLGLCDFLQSSHPVVGWVITALIIFWMMLYIVSICSPMVTTSCPYKMPFFGRAVHIIRGSLFRIRYGQSWRQRTACQNSYYRFPGDERGIRRDAALDVPALISADKALGDNGVLSVTLRNCVRRAKGVDVVRFARAVFAHRLDRTVTSLKCDLHFDRIPTRAFVAVLDILVDAIERELTKPDVEWNDWMSEAITCLSYAVRYAEDTGRTIGDIASRNVDVIYALLSLKNSRIVEEVLTIVDHKFPPVTSLDLQSDSDACRVGLDIIAIAQNLLDIANLHPVHILRKVLSTLGALRGVSDKVLRKCSMDFDGLQAKIATTISKKQGGSLAGLSTQATDTGLLTQDILASCHRLNQVEPGFVGAEILSCLSQPNSETLPTLTPPESPLPESTTPDENTVGQDSSHSLTDLPISTPIIQNTIPASVFSKIDSLGDVPSAHLFLPSSNAAAFKHKILERDNSDNSTSAIFGEMPTCNPYQPLRIQQRSVLYPARALPRRLSSGQTFQARRDVSTSRTASSTLAALVRMRNEQMP